MSIHYANIFDLVLQLVIFILQLFNPLNKYFGDRIIQLLYLFFIIFHASQGIGSKIPSTNINKIIC